VIEEAGGGLTLSRLVDGASCSRAPTEHEPMRASFPLFVKMLRNGFVGEKTLYVTCRDPESEEDPRGVGEARLLFADDPRILFAIATVSIDFTSAELGTFWFDIFFRRRPPRVVALRGEGRVIELGASHRRSGHR
jgi:hypothetical protein